MVSSFDIERLARALGPEPEPGGIGCDERVKRQTYFESCGRVAVNIVTYDGTWTYYRCKLHTTVELRHGYRIARPLTQADHDAADAKRREAWLDRARRVAEAYEADA